MEEELVDVNELDEIARFIWADDPDIQFVDAPTDRNAPHGQNLEEEMLVNADPSSD